MNGWKILRSKTWNVPRCKIKGKSHIKAHIKEIMLCLEYNCHSIFTVTSKPNVFYSLFSTDHKNGFR